MRVTCTIVVLSIYVSVVAAAVVVRVPSPTVVRRGFTDIPASITKLIGSAIPSDAAGGILPGWLTIPTEDEIKKQLGLNDTTISSLPIQIMNIPGYANWTSQGWNVRIHGEAFRNPPLTNDQLDAAAKVFVPDLDETGFTDANRAMARNVTAALLTLPVSDINLTFAFKYNTQAVANVTFPLPTDGRGEFDLFVSTNFSNAVPAGDNNAGTQGLELLTNNYISGNASTYLVPPTGITLVADIDDILRIIKIYEPEVGLNNSFAQPYVPWMNMPEVFKAWSQRVASLHVHYLTTTPIKATPFYESFVYANFPFGSFDIRPLNLTTIDQIFQVRKVDLDRVFQSFPQRKFVLIADTSNGDVMRDYPALVTDYPGQVQCILLRNTSATDPGDKFPYNTAGFKNVSNSTYMFFRTPDDIYNLDFSKGDCRNASVPQNVTFSYQGLPSIKNSAHRVGTWSIGVLALISSIVGGSICFV